jgi:hypothetical protein
MPDAAEVGAKIAEMIEKGGATVRDAEDAAKVLEEIPKGKIEDLEKLTEAGEKVAKALDIAEDGALTAEDAANVGKKSKTLGDMARGALDYCTENPKYCAAGLSSLNMFTYMIVHGELNPAKAAAEMAGQAFRAFLAGLGLTPLTFWLVVIGFVILLIAIVYFTTPEKARMVQNLATGKTIELAKRNLSNNNKKELAKYVRNNMLSNNNNIRR